MGRSSNPSASRRRAFLAGLAAAFLPVALQADVNRWARIGPPGSGSTAPIRAIAIDPRSSSTIYAGGFDGVVYKTVDGGATWDGSPTPISQVRALLVDPTSPGTIYAAGLGIAKSVDSGNSWFSINSGLAPGGNVRGVNALAIQPGNSAILYAGADIGGGVYKSVNGGAAWVQSNAGIPLVRTPGFPDFPPTVSALVVDPDDPLTVYAGTSLGAFKSTNGAGSWAAINAGLGFGSDPAWVRSLAIDPVSTDTLYAGTLTFGVFKTVDGGASWSRRTSGALAIDVFEIAIDPLAPATVYAAARSNGVLRTTNGGSSWTSLNQGLPQFPDVATIAVDPSAPSKLYAGDVSFAPGVFARTVVDPCSSSPTTLCLNGNRFRVEVSWRAVHLGTSGVGRAVPLTSDTGYFWFFGSENVELVLKVVNGFAVNGRFWVFYGALSDVEYTIRVTDTVTGAAKTYFNAQGTLASVADTAAFVATGSPDPQVSTFVPEAPRPADAAACSTTATALCLNASRFRVTVQWRAANIGASGVGQAQSLTSDTGHFWFFSANNLELVVKVVDGHGFNGKFWVFYGALSDVEYTITVTDTETGAERTYFNPQGQLASVADTSAF